LADSPKDSEQSLGTLFARLIDDGTNLFRAELNLYRQAAFRRVAQAKLPVIMIVAAVLLAQSAVTVILVGFALGLARWLGPAGGGLAVGVVSLAICGLLVMVAIKRLTATVAEANVKEAVALTETVVEEKVAEKVAEKKASAEASS
jgi:hypothetical protein